MPKKKHTEEKRCWFVTGSEESDVKKRAAQLATELEPASGLLGVEIYESSGGTAEEMARAVNGAAEALQTIGMFERLVWLKSTPALGTSAAAGSEVVQEALERLIGLVEAGVPEGVRLLVSAPDPDKRRSAYKRLSAAAHVEVFDKKDFAFGAGEAELAEWVERRVSEAGLRCVEDAIEVITARVGADARQLDVEIEKLTLAADGKPVGPELVRAIVPATRHGDIFDLSNCILRRELPQALSCLDQLFDQKERGVGILLAAIVPPIRNLLLVGDLMERHGIAPPAKPWFFGKTLEKLPPEAVAHLPRKKDGSLNTYPLGLAAAHVSRHNLERLRKSFVRCREANRQLVTSMVDERLVLGTLLMELLV